ncbi:MAG: hypothetical protein CMP84_13980 [Gammaproteobacteria bacterium]|nr:hypothetical protein [Gammaproteobacteria bacterium]|tara:strand:+ start:281 stop:484 length:204 start_codon:yes stop_codon:yes gene_type:complete
MTTNYSNTDLVSLIEQAHQAFTEGDKLKASALRAKINIKLRKRGDDPMEFWSNFQQAAEYYQSTLSR